MAGAGAAGDDWAAQAEEVAALAAIFGPDFEVLGVQRGGAGEPAGGPRVDADSLAGLPPPPGGRWATRCRLAVGVDLPPGGLLLRAQGAGGGDADDGGHRVAFLPPLALDLVLGPGYPSAAPPEAALSAPWLGGAGAAALLARLEAAWTGEGYKGAPVVFAWAEWLKSSALEALGAGAGALALEPDGGGGGGEARLLALLRHAAAAERAAFAAGTHACGVCLEERRGTEFVRLDACGHRFCKECVAAHAALHVAEGTLDGLRCAAPRCGAPLPPHVLRALLPAAAYERWERLSLERALDAMPDAARCPRCGTVALEDADACADCPRCFFVFCSLCEASWHPGVACVSAATRLEMLRRKAAGGGAAALAELRRREQDLASEAAVAAISRPCPKCGAAIEKDAGCNKVVCAACSAAMCYRCGADITAEKYRHYREGSACVLFEEAELLRWEARWEEQVAAHRVEEARARNFWVGAAGGGAGGGGEGGGGGAREVVRPSACPQCGQGSWRLANNNHLVCWSCGCNWCHQCRAVLPRRRRGGGQAGPGGHFGPGGCRQHSAD